MPNHNDNIGQAGEEMAVRTLREKGLVIVERRVRFRRGEIDIVARDGAEWVFVEVKTRTSDVAGHSSEAMTPRKIASLERAVSQYIYEHGLDDDPVRCDLVTIDFAPDGQARIEHYPGGIVFD